MPVVYQDTMTIKRTITIPKKVNGEIVLAIVELGARILHSKDATYQMFFQKGLPAVKEQLEKDFIAKGGTKEMFDALLEKCIIKVNGKEQAYFKNKKTAVKIIPRKVANV